MVGVFVRRVLLYAARRVSCCPRIDYRIAFALQEVVQAKPAILGSYARRLEIESIEGRNPPCGVNDEIGIELYCPAVTFGVNDIVVTSLFYRSDVKTGLHTYSDPIKGIHQPAHQFPLEGAPVATR